MSEVFKINDIEYECEFKLSNPDKQEVSFTKSAIKGMTLVDNVFEPFLSGTISIANPYDFIENEYFLRGDGRDELYILFKPLNPRPEYKDEQFEHTFIIIDDSNASKTTTRAESIKTFSLVAKDAIKFMDEIPYGKVWSGKVGEILQTIFKDILGKDKVDSKNWEMGDFELTYYTPATFRYMDLIRYFLRLYYAKDGEIYVKGFISYDDATKKYRLDLLSKIYAENDNNTIEAFALGDLTSDIDTKNPNNPQSGPPVGEYIGGLRNVGYSTPLYGWTTDFFTNSLVIGYDRILGAQKIRKITFKDIKRKWGKKFVDPFKTISGKPKLFAIQNDTTEKRFKRFKFPYPVEDGIKIVEAETHNALTFYNLQVSFSNIGNTMRKSGKFMDIFSTRGDTKMKCDEKLLGRWYITEVRHIFFGDLYTNQLFGTKTYIGPNSNVKESGVL